MKITTLLKADIVSLDLFSTSKDTVLDELIGLLYDGDRISDKATFKEDILKREAHTSTGIGDQIAIPHAKSKAVKEPAIAFGRSKSGIDFESLDGKKAHLFFMIAAPEGANNDHLDTLARLSGMLMDDAFREALLSISSKEELITMIDNKEREREASEQGEQSSSSKRILAVTGCPTGIAHTYMAADALKAKAKEMGVDIKVETRGSGGVKNALTASEIEEADAIIIASDTNADRDRFNGKVLIEAGVTDGIRRPEALIKDALKTNAPVFTASSSSRQTSQGKQKNAFYRHLMNGVSHMLPFVVGGGILIALGFMFGIEAHVLGNEDYNRFAEALNTIGGGSAFGLMIPVLAGFIAMSIADRPGLAPGMVGGFMAAQGESGFLGGLVAGFLAGYLVLLLKVLFKKLPQSLDGIKTILIYPLLGIFLTGMIMFFVVEIPLGEFNTALGSWLQGLGTTNAILLGLILGGMMAVDMGGPINKAAYTFGIAMIAEGFLTPHAAIMAGGMVPPLGIALATFIFRNRFTREEKDAGVSNIIMGLSFITEGAIPFAAADPARVIPSLIVGSSVAGALSMAFSIGLPAPHGGLFVIPLVEGSAWLYLLAILIGTIVTTIMLGLLKKPIPTE